MGHGHQTPAPHGLDPLRVEQVGQRHPARLGRRAWDLTAGRLYPLPIVGQQGAHIRPKPIGEQQRGTGRGPRPA
jgi:hypothetical protein